MPLPRKRIEKPKPLPKKRSETTTKTPKKTRLEIAEKILKLSQGARQMKIINNKGFRNLQITKTQFKAYKLYLERFYDNNTAINKASIEIARKVRNSPENVEKWIKEINSFVNYILRVSLYGKTRR